MYGTSIIKTIWSWNYTGKTISVYVTGPLCTLYTHPHHIRGISLIKWSGFTSLPLFYFGDVNNISNLDIILLYLFCQLSCLIPHQYGYSLEVYDSCFFCVFFYVTCLPHRLEFGMHTLQIEAFNLRSIHVFLTSCRRWNLYCVGNILHPHKPKAIETVDNDMEEHSSM